MRKWAGVLPVPKTYRSDIRFEIEGNLVSLFILFLGRHSIGYDGGAKRGLELTLHRQFGYQDISKQKLEDETSHVTELWLDILEVGDCFWHLLRAMIVRIFPYNKEKFTMEQHHRGHRPEEG